MNHVGHFQIQITEGSVNGGSDMDNRGSTVPLRKCRGLILINATTRGLILINATTIRKCRGF